MMFTVVASLLAGSNAFTIGAPATAPMVKSAGVSMMTPEVVPAVTQVLASSDEVLAVSGATVGLAGLGLIGGSVVLGPALAAAGGSQNKGKGVAMGVVGGVVGGAIGLAGGAVVSLAGTM
eukprot:scaffold39170_cov31-Tisochrysis_lutea.AAC.1